MAMITKFGRYFVYLALCIVGVANVFWPLFTNHFNVVQPDLGDSVFNAVILEHVYKSFFDFDYKANFYSPMFFYPDRLVLTYSDNLLGSAPVYWVLRLFFAPLLSAQLWGIIVVVLTYFAYIYFLRSLKVLPILSALVSFVFCFGLLKVNGIAHPQMFPQFYTPLVFVALISFLKSPNLRLFNLTIGLIFLQILAGYYLGWFLIFSLIIFVPLYTFLARNDLLGIVVFVKSYKSQIIKSLLIWFIVFAAFWAPYFYTSSRIRYSCCNDMISNLLMTPERYVRPPEGGLYSKIFNLKAPDYGKLYIWGYGGYLFEGLFGLLVLYAGYSLFVENIKAGFMQKIALSMFATGLILNILSLKIFNFSLWFLVYNVIPGADGIRFVHRIWYISYFYMFSAAAIYFSNRFEKNINLKILHKFMLSILFIFLVVEQISFLNVFVDKKGIDSLVSKLDSSISTNNCPLFYFKTTKNEQQTITYSLAAMYASISQNVPTINGYSGLMSIDLRTPLTIEGIQKKIKNSYQGEICYIQESEETKELSVSKYLLPLKQN